MDWLFIAWRVAGVVFSPIVYARTLAEFQRGFPTIASMKWREDRFFAGIIAFVVLLFPFSAGIPMFFGTHGYMWRWSNPHTGAAHE